VNDPNVYDSSLPTKLANYVPHLAAFLKGKIIKTSASNVTSITSLGGVSFDVFAKNKEWNQELYEDLVAPYYSSDMLVETWQNGVGKLPSYCKPDYQYNVMNIQDVQLVNGISWKETADHSKWAITMTNNYTCIGDINRVSGQLKRGGGTVCSNQINGLWNAFSSIISSVDNC